MRKAIAATFVLGLALVFWSGTQAGEKGKEVTLKGKITCAKCELKQEKACMTVIVVKEDVFYFDKESHKKNHKAICQEGKPGQVTGVTGKDGKKLTITVKDLKFD